MTVREGPGSVTVLLDSIALRQKYAAWPDWKKWLNGKYISYFKKKIDLRRQMVIDCDRFLFSCLCPSQWRTVTKWNSSISGWSVSSLLAKGSENLTWAHDYWLLNGAFFINQTMTEAKREKDWKISGTKGRGKKRKSRSSNDTNPTPLIN